MGMAEAAVRAVEAGTHMVEICRAPALLFAAYEALLREAETSPAFARVLRQAATRVQTFKANQLKKDVLPSAPTPSAVNKMKTAVERFREQVVKAGPA
jgi:beta-N-acetylhexosaminidase